MPGREKPDRSHVVSGKIIKLTGPKASEDYPGKLRVLTCWVEEEPGGREKRREMVFVTNNFMLSPVMIVEICRNRWKIEAFRNILKENLKTKTFMGASANAVKSQVYSALIAIHLLKNGQAMCRMQWRIGHLFSIIGRTL